MMYREITAVCWDIHTQHTTHNTQHTNAIRGHNVACFNAKFKKKWKFSKIYYTVTVTWICGLYHFVKELSRLFVNPTETQYAPQVSHGRRQSSSLIHPRLFLAYHTPWLGEQPRLSSSLRQACVEEAVRRRGPWRIHRGCSCDTYLGINCWNCSNLFNNSVFKEPQL